MALNTGNANNGLTHEKTSVFFISNCGGYCLNYDFSKQEANGKIIDKLKSMKINKRRPYCTEAGDIIIYEFLQHSPIFHFHSYLFHQHIKKIIFLNISGL